MSEFDWLEDTTAQTVGKSDSFAWLEDDYSIESPDALDSSIKHTRQVSKRLSIMAEKEQNLAKLITHLPPTDSVLYVVGAADGREHSRTGQLTHGSFDFGSFIPVCVDMLLTESGESSGVDLFISTWIFNRDFVLSLQTMLDDGRLKRFSLLADKFIKRRHTSAVYGQLMEVMDAHPGCRVRLAPNHCKILCLSVGNYYVTITGSSNASAVARTEQYVIDTSPDVYRFFVQEFFENILNRKDSRRA